MVSRIGIGIVVYVVGIQRRLLSAAHCAEFSEIGATQLNQRLSCFHCRRVTCNPMDTVAVRYVVVPGAVPFIIRREHERVFVSACFD